MATNREFFVKNGLTVNGNTSISGTITSGAWNGSIIGGTYGGTGANNGARTITIGGNVSTANTLTTSGNFALTLTTTAATNVTLPTSGTLVSSADTGTVTSTMIADGTIVNADINASAAIAVSKLAASTISGVTLGNNLNTLTLGSYLTGTSYNGSTGITAAVDATSAATASKVVARDASGNFSANTITAAIYNADPGNAVGLLVNGTGVTSNIGAVEFSYDSTITGQGSNRTHFVYAGKDNYIRGRTTYISSGLSVSGDTTFSAPVAFNGGVSGTSAPFTVDSTTTVTNLSADLLDGESLVDGAATVNSVVGRDGSGDIFARLLRTTYANESTINAGAAVHMRVNATTDNYSRAVPGAAFVTWLNGFAGLDADTLDGVDGSNYLRGDVADTGLQLTLTSSEGLKLVPAAAANPYIGFYVTGGATRVGYVQGLSTGGLRLADGDGGARVDIGETADIIEFTTSGISRGNVGSAGNLNWYEDIVTSKTIAANGTIVIQATGTDGTNSRQGKVGVFRNGALRPCAYVLLEQEDAGNSYLWGDNAGNLRTSTTSADIGTTGGTVVGAQTSDERLKQIEDSFPYGLEEVRALKPIRFRYLKDDTYAKLGFGAQTTIPIIPESVTDTGECIDGYTADPTNDMVQTPNSDRTKLIMEYTQLIPVLTAALQEADRTIQTLVERVTALELQIHKA